MRGLAAAMPTRTAARRQKADTDADEVNISERSNKSVYVSI